MANTYCEYTQVAPTDNNTWTFSCWFKRANTTAQISLFSGDIDGDNQTKCRMMTTGEIQFIDYQSSANTGKLTTNRKFRDSSAWMHIVCVWDSDNVTAGDRMKMYINGVEEGSVGGYSTDVNPSSGQATVLNANTRVMRVGRDYDGGYWQGCISHVQFVDGLALAPTEFGEVDATSGIWKIKTGAYATPGNNGFFLKMEDRTNLDLDSSSNAKSFTTTGDLTATYDNPDNNFCTLNPLANYINGSTFTQGNNTMTTRNGDRSYNTATMGLTSGKWYFETYMNALVSGTGQNTLIGIADAETTDVGNQLGILATQYGYYSTTGGSYNSNTDTSYGDTYTTGDYIGTYIDLDNNKIYWAKDGVIQNSGTGVTITAPSAMTLLNGGAYLPALGFWSSVPVYKYNVNFGNGYFGTTVISSPEADAGGIGAFKYDPSVGTFDSSSKDFRAICTKNIKAYGG